MKRLGLLRHAKSDWGESDKRDFDRGLNDRGRRGSKVIGDHIRKHGVKWDKVIASPAERVKRTLENGLPELEVEWDKRLYLASTDTILDVLRECDDGAEAVLIVGHNPGLGDMVLEMVAPLNENDAFDEARVKFPTAAYAVFDLEIDSWAELRTGTATLTHFKRPRDLDSGLGPEY
ncbi:SixA phosphatase family protein [Qipengyuania sp. DGS5-3]|uniref:SixA phosphatase family protein n=1 Tax=Qipengyuania sp. DGS5-3 TaxID=3349632 RepID=UPI0036D2D219